MAKTLSIEDQEIHRKSIDDKRVKIYIEDPNVFHVEKILDIRAITTEVEYLVKWKGYSAKHNNWVAEKDITNDLKRAFSLQKKKKEIKRLTTEIKRLKEYRAERSLRHQIVKKCSAPIKGEEVDDVEFDEPTQAVRKYTFMSTKCELTIKKDHLDYQNNEADSTLKLNVSPIDSISEKMRKLTNEMQNDFKSYASVLLEEESANVTQLIDEDTRLLLGYDKFMQAVFE